MTDAQGVHMENLGHKFIDEMFKKYEKGAKEHGGNLWDLSAEQLLDNAIEEAIDNVVYLYTLRDKLSSASNHSSLSDCLKEVQKAIRKHKL